MTTHLISKDKFQAAYFTQLPQDLLDSSEFYCTPEGYSVLLNFCDDDNIVEAQQENQYSQGLDEWLDIQIDRLFKLTGCPDVFPDEAIVELREIIDIKLSSLDLSKAIIK